MHDLHIQKLDGTMAVVPKVSRAVIVENGKILRVYAGVRIVSEYNIRALICWSLR